MMQQSQAWIPQYLSTLGMDSSYPIEKELTYSYLQSICTAQLNTFAFENISKLIYYRDHSRTGRFIPTIEEFLRAHQTYQFGGTCYTQNTQLYQLLKAIGFSCNLIMLGDVHMAILVSLPELPNERVYIDCGAAAPFFEPVRFETDVENITKFGHDQVWIRPVSDEKQGIYEYTRYMNGTLSGRPWRFNSNTYNSLEDFQPLIEKANLPGTTFMKILRCQIWQLAKARSVSLVNNVLTIRMDDGTTLKEALSTIDDIEQVMSEEFQLPKLPVREAIGILADLGVDIFQEEPQS